MQQVLPVADGCVSWRVSSLPALFVQELSVQLSYFYDAFANNYYVQILLRGMQCGATALILDVGINLLQKELKKKLLLPCLIIFGTFIANYFFQVNIMYLILIDAVIGYLWLQDEKYS